ncbi:MAG TPA: DUF6522 family protein [Burkholderiales bacterium]|nr:DUF6522 family protein [Burkholderiales bacterium]
MTRIGWDADGLSVDATLIAGPLQTTPQRVLALIRAGLLTTRCERGVDEDVGRFRLSFRLGARRLQLLVDSGGNVLGQSVVTVKSRRSVRAGNGPRAAMPGERGR